MSVLAQKSKIPALFQRTESLETPWQIISWWEKRRAAYNLIVGAVGLLTCLLTACIAFYFERNFGEAIGLPDPPIFALLGIIFYGVTANVCYTSSWLFELIAKLVWKERARHFGEITFTLGIIFSALITFLPAVVFFVVLVVKSFIPRT